MQNNTKPKKVLVTGASGFIGSALVRHLYRNDTPVIATARGNIALLSQELGIEVRELDVMGELSIADDAFNEADTLVHCATPNDIQSKADDGGFTLGVTGTYRLIEHAVRHNIRRIIYLSTLQVYGTELEGIFDESTPVDCENPYGLNHYLGEEVCKLAAHRYGIDIVALRPSNVYGIPSVSTVDRSSLVPMCFIKEAISTGAVALRSSGRQQRNFVSTDEVAEIIALLINQLSSGFSVVNAVSKWQASIVEIAQMVEEIWHDTRDDTIEIRIQSDLPVNGNQFAVTSKYIPPCLTHEQSRARMSEVIRCLITKFQPK